MALPAGKVHFKASEEWREVLPHHVLPNGLEVLPAPMAADPAVDEWYPLVNVYITIQWEFQDPKMKVLYNLGGISPYIGLTYSRYL